MASTVAMSLEGIPLKTTLRLILNQLGMMYEIRDGLMIITSQPSEEDMNGTIPGGAAENPGFQ
jgi:hypothetical protein